MNSTIRYHDFSIRIQMNSVRGWSEYLW